MPVFIMECFEEYFKELYVVCKSDNSYGGKLKPDKVKDFKEKLDNVSKRKVDMPGFMAKYVVDDNIKVSIIYPNTVIISAEKDATLDDIELVLVKILCNNS